MRSRFAPSPTGDLHLGSVAVALTTALLSERVRLRFEDIDTPRVVPGASTRQAEDLARLGLTYAEPAWFQSERVGLYQSALNDLSERKLVYLCDCSRQEISSAPHAGEEVRYPGTCAEKSLELGPLKRPPAVRLRVASAVEPWHDERLGPFSDDVARTTGDFPLRRGDGCWTYHFACAFDDGVDGVELVVRGEDLVPVTARQRYLQRLLGLSPPKRYMHIPLFRAPGGERLAKRHGAFSVRALCNKGVSPEEILGRVAASLGFIQGRPFGDVAELRQRLTRPSSWFPGGALDESLLLPLFSQR